MIHRPDTSPWQPPSPRPVDWRDRGICAGAPDVDLWFPIGQGAEADAQTMEAKQICGRCPVMDACRAWSLDTRQEWGVFGGLDQRERAKALSRRAPVDLDADPASTGRPLKPCGTQAAYDRHRKNKEDPCEKCIDAQKERRRQRREQQKAAAAAPPAEHGTPDGIVQHRRAKEALCAECRALHEQQVAA